MILVLLSLIACGDPDPSFTVDEHGPTYHGDVAPILRARCEGCHSAGQIAPFTLNSYDEVSILGAQIVDSVETRRMPPWLASDDCNSYEGSRWLAQEEIDTIREWVEAGKPEGDAASALPAFEPVEDVLANPTHSVAIAQPYAPDFEGSDDDYRCFVVDPQVATDGFVTGYQIIPSDPEIVHHMILYLPSSDSAVDQALAYDAAEEGDGYTCYGDARVNSSMLAAWAPGSWSAEYPEGTGIALPAGRPIVIQMHYNNSGSPDAADATEVLLRVEPEVQDELYSFFWVTPRLDIPAGAESHTEESESTVKRFVGDLPGRLRLHDIGPHMHTLGESLNATLVHEDGSETCLIDVPRWDFNWQFGYEFTEPVAMEMDDKVRLSCTYDASDRTEDTRWGEGTGDEMCLTTMFVTYEAD